MPAWVLVLLAPPQQRLPAPPTPSVLKHLPLTFPPTTGACSPPGHTQPCSSQTPSLPTSKVTALLSSPSTPLHALCTPVVLQSHGFGHTPICQRCPGAAGSLGLPLTSHTNSELKTSLQCCIQGPLIPPSAVLLRLPHLLYQQLQVLRPHTSTPLSAHHTGFQHPP